MNGSNDFRQVRKLLSLKRHEQPPPGYFDSFSNRVIARIEREEEIAQRPWWDKLLALIECNPIGACAYGLVFFLTVLLGVNFYQSEITTFSNLWSSPSVTALNEPGQYLRQGRMDGNANRASDNIEPEYLFLPSMDGRQASYPRVSPPNSNGNSGFGGAEISRMTFGRVR